MQVLGADGAPLPALFAAGNAAAGIVSAGGHGYGIGWAIISGRRAGQSAARVARAGGTL
jgi:predicted oxidoreductase